MEIYIGTMIIRAVPSTRESVEVISKKGDGYFVQYEDGYQTWRPKEVFDKTYRRMNLLTFGIAIEALRKRFKVAALSGTTRGCGLNSRFLMSPVR
jgi:hypothetical protein